ncbi:tripartite motif-containing protein 2-like, partial [Saccostrea echinata]|uniref:tripartite motif-containing protein 2-like n=1 Tax=Saccostrea echinata TaxID=191078 RepID=UPI002A802DBB
CNTCHVKLCKPCMSIHVHQGHTSLVQSGCQDSQRPFTTCKTHEGNTCAIQCVQCETPVCNKCIISGRHKNHDFIELSDHSEDVKDSDVVEIEDTSSTVTENGDPVLLLEVDTNNSDLDRIEICQPDKIWISVLYESTISCMVFSGAVKDSVNVTSGEYPSDIAANGEKDLYVCDWKDKTVSKYNMDDKTLDIVIRLQEWIPRAICGKDSGDLLVCMTNSHLNQCKVIQYDVRSIKKEIQYDEQGEDLFSFQGGYIFMTENGNGDICVSLTAHRSLVVVNRAGEFRFSYRGTHDTRKDGEFSPQGVATDQLCQILIADSEIHCIHIVDIDGHFVTYIDNISLMDPRDIAVNSLNGNLYVCEFSTGKIKIIKYLT